MHPSSKKSSSSADVGLDRLFNDLPNDILGRVLSFLPTKDRLRSEGVCTTWRQCSLGENWKEVFLDTSGPEALKWMQTIADRSPAFVETVHHCTLGNFKARYGDSPSLEPIATCFGNLKKLELNVIVNKATLEHLYPLTSLESLKCLYFPFAGSVSDFIDDDHEDEINTLENFAKFLKLSSLSVEVLEHPFGTVYPVDLASTFQGLVHLRSLRLMSIKNLVVGPTLLKVVAQLENLELNGFADPVPQVLDAPHLTRLVYTDVGMKKGGPKVFPMKTAPKLLELSLSAESIGITSQAVEVCGQLTTLDLDLDEDLLNERYLQWTAEGVEKWPDLSMLRHLRLGRFSPRPPYLLFPFSKFSRLETLKVDVKKNDAVKLVSPGNSMNNLKALELRESRSLIIRVEDDDKLDTFDLGGGLQNLPSLQKLLLHMHTVKGQLQSSSLEMLWMEYTAFKFENPFGNALFQNLPKLHTLHLGSEFHDESEVMVLVQGIVGLQNLRNLVLLRVNLQGFSSRNQAHFEDVHLAQTVLRSISNTANVYDRIVVADPHEALVLRRSSMPRTKHLEIRCYRFDLETGQAGEDWLHRTESLRVRLGGIENGSSSVLDQLIACPHVHARRFQKNLKYDSHPEFVDCIEATKYDFESLPPEFK